MVGTKIFIASFTAPVLPGRQMIIAPFTMPAVKRDNIAVKHVPYWGIDEDGIGYIRITRFSKKITII